VESCKEDASAFQAVEFYKVSDNYKILLVEDDLFLRELYAKLLSDEGFKVDLAVNGLEAERLMKQGGYDLVLLDLMLPGKSGVEILRSMNEQEKAACGKIVALSNLAQDGVVDQVFKLGAAGFLIKSDYTPDEMMAKVYDFLSSEPLE